MSSSAAFFQILYQNETLFQVGEKPVARELVVEKQEPKIIAAQPVATIQPVPQPVKTPATPIVTSPAQAVATEKFPALNHQMLILVDEPKQKDLLVSEALFLNNILKAVGNSTETSDILNFSFLASQDARQVFADKKTNYFITFGVPLIKLHLDFLLVPYTPKFVEGIWFLLADPLVVIEADRNLKKKLWQALQKMFEMS